MPTDARKRSSAGLEACGAVSTVWMEKDWRVWVMVGASRRRVPARMARAHPRKRRTSLRWRASPAWRVLAITSGVGVGAHEPLYDRAHVDVPSSHSEPCARRRPRARTQALATRA